MTVRHATCSWPSCPQNCDGFELPWCIDHWNTLPLMVRDELLRARCENLDSPGYQAAQDWAYEWIVRAFGVSDARDKYDPGRWERLVAFVRERDAARGRPVITTPATPVERKPVQLTLLKGGLE